MKLHTINVTKFGDAGEVTLYNKTESTKLIIESFQPFDCALFAARQLSIILDCGVTIDWEEDDKRQAKCVVPHYVENITLLDN